MTSSLAVRAPAKEPKAKVPPLRQQVLKPKQKTIVQVITSDETKKLLNYVANGGAALFNLFTFINGNFHFTEAIQEKLETFSETISRVATGTQGLVLAADTWKTKNLIPLIGFFLEIPVAIFTKGQELWVRRGIPQALGQFYRIIDQREIIDENGNPKLKDGKVQVIGGDFSKNGNNLGWWKGFTTTLKEMPKLIRELIDDSSKIKKLPHGLFQASIFQSLGTVVSLFGFNKLGPGIRDAAGILCDYALMRDENLRNIPTNALPPVTQQPKQNSLGLNFSSIFVWSGFVYMCAAIVDFAKRFEYFLDKVNNLTDFSLFFDRGAALMYTMGNLNIKRAA